MTLHREGKLIIINTLVFCLLSNFLTRKFIDNEIVHYAVLISSIILAFLIIQFFRIPKRNVTIDESLVYSPCDGKVVVIEEVDEPEFLKGKALQISVFMSPINVHANWFPVSGKVVYDKYHPGKYLVAWHPKSSTENERTTICVETPKGQKVLFRQIAGALARRIKYYCKAGDSATQGNEFGFIKFGSRVDIYLPLNTKVHVNIGDVVQGKLSKLAELQA